MQQQPNEDVTDIIIDESPAPVEVDELPSVHDRESFVSILHHQASKVRALRSAFIVPSPLLSFSVT